MARGWESKAVESQQADADRPRQVGPPLTDEARLVANREAIEALS